MKTFYLTIEEAKRELASRILLAGELVEPAARVVIGQQWRVDSNLANWPAGGVLLKGANAPQVGIATRAKAAGHKVFTMDEETFGCADEELCLKMFDPRAMGIFDMIFTPGPAVHSWLTKAGYPTAMVGNPRSSIAKCGTIDPDLTDAIIINTNAAGLNHAHWTPAEVFNVQVRTGWCKNTKAAAEKFQDFLTFDKSNIRNVVEYAKASSDRVIIRPHPSENADRWRQWLPGIEVRPNIPLGTALASAKEIVVTGCTTGPEAVLAGRKMTDISTHPLGRKYVSRRLQEGEPIEDYIVDNHPAALISEAMHDHVDASEGGLGLGEPVHLDETLAAKGRFTKDEAVEIARGLGLYHLVFNEIGPDLLEVKGV
jgi:surface carbohydrate biosynthesis protein